MRRCFIVDSTWTTPRFPDAVAQGTLFSDAGMKCIDGTMSAGFSTAAYDDLRARHDLPAWVSDLALACEATSRIVARNHVTTSGNRLFVIFAVQESALMERWILGTLPTSALPNLSSNAAAKTLAHIAGADPVNCIPINAACATGNYAICLARELIGAGSADHVLLVAAFSMFRGAGKAFRQMGIAARNGCLPFHPDRAGPVLSEGAAAMLIAPEAEDRPAVEVLGYGLSADGFNQIAPDPTGAWVESAMRQALDRSGIEISELDYINAHGTATKSNDTIELAAIARLGKTAATISSTKAYTGHCLLAASAIEAAICHRVLADQAMPVDDYLTGVTIPGIRFHCAQAAPRPLRYAMSNAFGFGGANSAVVLGAC